MSDEIRPSTPAGSDADWDAIARFVAGDSDAPESRRVEQWLAAHPEDAALVAIVKGHAERAVAQSVISANTEQALSSVRRRMAVAEARPALTVQRGRSAGASWAWRAPVVALAAGVLAVVGITQWLDQRGGTATAQEYVTAVGQSDSITLADGSTVVLAPGSRLTVAAGFGGRRRDVQLEGAAFFQVEHDKRRPFTVRSRAAEITDIGTAFSVKTDAEGRVSVAVSQGIVALRDTSATVASAIELGVGDRGVLHAGTVTIARGTVVASDMSWTRGELAYRDAPLAEVQADLRRWYGIELQVRDSVLARRTLTASFRGDSSAQVLELIALALGADAVQRGDTIVLQSPGSGSTRSP
jgi:transmembrane sensor